MTDWKNRIVGYGEETPDQLLANPHNHRIHPKRQQDALSGSLETLGYIQTVIVNRLTGHIVDGHLRVTMALREGQTSIPVTYVELTPEEEAQALLSLDPIAAMAANDRDKVDELLRMVSTDNEQVMKHLADFANENGLDYLDQKAEDDKYTRKIEAPIYTPKGDKPALSDMYDETRTKELIAEIEASELPEDEKQFLKIAAQRHTVLNFKRIAEYYAHSPAPVQRLMENSALVIIDFKRAIELGYVKLSEEIAAQYLKDYPDA